MAARWPRTRQRPPPSLSVVPFVEPGDLGPAEGGHRPVAGRWASMTAVAIPAGTPSIAGDPLDLAGDRVDPRARLGEGGSSRRARAAPARSASRRSAVDASVRERRIGHPSTARANPSATIARASDTRPSATARSATAASSAARSSVPPAAARRRLGFREREAPRRGRRGTCPTGRAGCEPEPGRADRPSRQPEPQEPVGLVPAAERDGGLRGDREDEPAVGPFDAERPDTLPTLARDLERLGRPPDPVEQGREVRRTERDPFRPAELVGDRDAGADALDALVDTAEQREVPAEDPEPERLVASRTDRPRDRDGLLGHRDGLAELAAEHQDPGAVGEDPGPGRRRRIGRDESFGRLDGRCGRGMVARLPEVPALSFVERAGAAGSAIGSTRAIARSPRSTAGRYSPISTAVSAARTRTPGDRARPSRREPRPTGRARAGSDRGRRGRRSPARPRAPRRRSRPAHGRSSPAASQW